MSFERAQRQVAHLLKLATHANTSPEEAATAMAKAQEIMTRYQIERIIEAPEVEVAENVENTAQTGAHLEDSKVKRIAPWRGRLAAVIARANQCCVYQGRNGCFMTIEMVGRRSDTETVRYLFSMLTKEVDRLTREWGSGRGRVWCNNFRLGVVEALQVKLREQGEATRTSIRKEAEAGESTALVRVNDAIAELDQRMRDVDSYIRQNLRLRTTHSNARSDMGAREAGRQAGAGINLSSRGGLGAGRRALGAGK